MKTNNAIYTLMILLSSLCIGCEKLIEVEMPNNQITADQVFEDVQTANAALAGLYAGLWESSPVAGDRTGELFGVYTDDLDFYATTSTTGVLDIYKNQQTPATPAIYSYWSAAYKNIYTANAIIEGVEQSVSLPLEDRKRIRTEAILIRSIVYYYLQQIFGGVPFVTTTDYHINQTLPKTPATQILNLLETDLTEVVSSLNEEYRNSERIYPNKEVARLMLAKVLLLENKNSSAEAILKTIVQSSLYQFQGDLSQVFNKSSTHILWQLKPKNTGDATKEALTYYFGNSAPNTYALTTDLVNSFSTGDLRKQHWMKIVTFNGNTWLRADKYKNRTNNTTEYSVVFRLEEVYLLLAEALAKQNKVSEALPYVNATRQRASLNPLPGSIAPTMLLNEILIENRREFFTEFGHRFFDLKRMNRLSDLISVKANWQSYHILFPLPQQELLLNVHLNPQNTGY